jgi:hypothetical protein
MTFLRLAAFFCKRSKRYYDGKPFNRKVQSRGFWRKSAGCRDRPLAQVVTDMAVSGCSTD